jgi:hypothetical protein
MDEPVYLLDGHAGDGALRDTLSRHARAGGTWIFPSNELVLNRVESARHRLPRHEAARLFIPGTARIAGGLSAANLSDKARIHRLLLDHPFRSLDLVRGIVVRWTGNPADLEPVHGLQPPFVVKPAVKDRSDSFTLAFPSKLVTVASIAELDTLLSDRPKLFLHRPLLIQELALGTPVSWCGYAAGGRVEGYRMRSVIRSPEGRVGGTGTLVRFEAVDAGLDAAVREIVEVLGLDGIFELEFIERAGRYHFFSEINPRPWLQVASVLGPESSIFTAYLAAHGLGGRGGPLPAATSLEPWGSTERLQVLGRARGLRSLPGFTKAMRSDVRLGRFFTRYERMRYLGSSLARLAVR